MVWHAGRKYLLIMVAIQTLSGVAAGVQLLVLAKVFSAFTTQAPAQLGAALPWVAALAAVTTVTLFLGSTLPEQRLYLAELVIKDAQDRILDVTTSVELEAYEDPTFFDHLRRVQSKATSQAFQITSSLLMILQSIVRITGVVVALAIVEPLMVGFVVAGFVPLWLATRLNSRTAYQFTYDMTTADRERQVLFGILTGREAAKEVRIFGMSPFVRDRYTSLYRERFTELRMAVATRLRRSMLATIASALAMTGGLAFLIWMVMSNRLAVAAAAVAAVAVRQLAGQVRGLNSGAGSMLANVLYLEDFESFISIGHRTAKERSSRSAAPRFRSIHLHDMTFAYPGTDIDVLHDIDLEITTGETVAIVGRNGSGKTTLAKLIACLYTPSSGCLDWNGVPADSYHTADLRRHIAAIFQDFMRYELSAHANIALGDHEHFDDHDRLVGAAHAAGIAEAIDRLPKTYETILSRSFRSGEELSIGQWQGIALARALFKDSELLVLDEPAAALDAQTEHAFFEAVRERHADRALVLISHRLSSVRNADRIYVLDGGRIIERGTHESLIEARGHCAHLFELQAGAYIDLTVKQKGLSARSRSRPTLSQSRDRST